MSHSKISFGGVLQPLVDSLERNPRQEGRLVGQDIVMTGRSDTQAIIALDANNDIHLLITPTTNGDSRLSEIDLKGLKVADIEWSVGGRSPQRYLDISCSTGIMPAFRRPFLKFAEDVLFEISQSAASPADAIYRTSLRWRKFWSPDIEKEITREWIHGLFGELLFLTDLVERFGPTVIDSWTGPLGKHHDFQTGTKLAVEIKTSADVPFRINCNIRQLDSDLFEKLYVVCYRLTTSENGTTLPELVKHIAKLIEGNESLLEKFYDRLVAAGYTLQLESAYFDFRLNHSQATVFHVDKDFPKIVEKSFINPPDHRISGIRYILELTGIKELTVGVIVNDLRLFKNDDNK